MTRDEFCKHHWEYYLVLEKDLLEVERYVSFDLGDDSTQPNTDYGNSACFSIEFIKQYLAICSEIDVFLKTICAEINNRSTGDKMDLYTNEILNKWPNIVQQKVKMKGIDLQPFFGWAISPYQSPYWWKPYNGVKHNRLKKYKDANLKNVLNSLAALYILEQYFAKYIGDRDKDIDVPNDVSKLFEMVDYKTENTVIGKDSYLITADEVDSLFDNEG